MELKSLTIKGFKSFGDKTTIHFDKGITAVVGPNGCGKSNVVDAIRWVLGEQKTRMLRSDKMENVIFNGTRTRKASQLAEVSLSFDNTKNILPTEYSQVTITRKYFRSGDSEYRLNDVPCRLKDITNLFMDTGIGSDSYAIIELRMVDEILNNKENARRNMIEEAAGVAKYKLRKKQTYSKLDETEKDLNRVEDLLFEIDSNLKTLEKQAKKTTKYYQLKEEYKVLSLQLAALRIKGYRGNHENLEGTKQKLEETRVELSAGIDKQQAEIQKQKLEETKKEKELSVEQKKVNEYLAKIRQYESDKKLRNERLGFLEEKEDRLNSDLSTDKEQAERIRRRINELKESEVGEQKMFNELQALLNELQRKNNEAEQEYAAMGEQLRKEESELQVNKDSVQKLEKEIEIVQIQEASLKNELDRSKEENESKKNEINDFSKAISELDKEYKKEEKAHQSLLEKREAAEKKIKKFREDSEHLRTELNKVQRKLDATDNEYQLTKSLVDSLEGFPESIRFLRKSPNWKRETPLLSDVIFCEEDFRVCIENYLESFMSYYVVENFEEAKKAIQLLSEASKGRANFFMLNALKDFSIQKDAKAPDNCLLAMDVVECDSKYKHLVAFLLKNVYIIDKNEETTLESNSFDKEKIFLTKSGKFTKRKFTVSGGSVGLFEGKRIGRAKNLEKLNKELSKLKENLSKHESLLEDKNNDLNEQLALLEQSQPEEGQQKLSSIKEELTSLRIRQEQYESFIKNNQLRREDILAKLEEYAEKIKAIQPELTGLRSLQGKQIALVEERRGQYAAISEKYNDLKNRFNQQNLAFHQQKNKVESLQKDQQHFEDQWKQANDRIERSKEELAKLKEELNNIVKNTDTGDEELQNMYTHKEEMEKSLAALEALYFETKGSISTMEDSLIDLRRKKDQNDLLLSESKEKVNDIKMELNALKERLSVEFNVNLNDIMETELPEDMDVDVVRENTAKVKDKIENFGPINPMAVEAYDEMKERSDFIVAQKKDLVDAKNSLLATIEEIDVTAKAKFMEAFTTVRDNFQNVFRSLFNAEDSCDLILMNEADPLESDIDIIAKPKGKKPLTINQLSGGEKTLTATALLFSLYLLKPAPFCIFDEVDAPLDDSNIDKFNHIIRKFSEQSQFIIVSHNKRTIASTDIVYGVTMVEEGVSKMVPVDMRQVQAVLN